MSTKVICAILLALCGSMQVEASNYKLIYPKGRALKPAVGDDGVLTIQYMELPSIGHDRYIDDDAYAKNNENIKKLVVKGTITFIGERAFSGCPNLEEIDLSEVFINRIRSEAFMGCPKLKVVKLNPYSRWVRFDELAFADCPELVEIKNHYCVLAEPTTFKGSPKVPAVLLR